MIDLSLPLIGPVASVFPLLEAYAKQRQGKPIAVLLDGNPGIGKSHVLDAFALALTRSPFAIETLNGQTVTVDVVRGWRERGPYGNLFSAWTVKRIDEVDQVKGAAASELLTYLDYLSPLQAVLVSTNDYSRMRAETKGRLETRFIRMHIDSPSIPEAVTYLTKHFKLSLGVASAIANGAVPDGCLPSEGVNMRACVEDAKGFLAARSAQRKGKAA